MMGLSRGDHRRGVRPSQGPHLGAQPFPDPSHRRLARFDQQLAVDSRRTVNPEEVEAVIEGDDARLVLVEGQTPGRQPLGQPCLDLFGLVPGVTQGDQIVGIPDQNRGARHRFRRHACRLLVSDPGGLFHPVQSNVQQHRAYHPALRSSLLGRGEPTVLDHTCLQPPGDQSPGGERAELAEQVVMIDSVERRRQVRVEHPPPPGVCALARRGRWPRSRHGSHGPAETHRTSVRTVPPTRVPTR